MAGNSTSWSTERLQIAIDLWRISCVKLHSFPRWNGVTAVYGKTFEGENFHGHKIKLLSLENFRSPGIEQYNYIYIYIV